MPKVVNSSQSAEVVGLDAVVLGLAVSSQVAEYRKQQRDYPDCLQQLAKIPPDRWIEGLVSQNLGNTPLAMDVELQRNAIDQAISFVQGLNDELLKTGSLSDSMHQEGISDRYKTFYWLLSEKRKLVFSNRIVHASEDGKQSVVEGSLRGLTEEERALLWTLDNFWMTGNSLYLHTPEVVPLVFKLLIDKNSEDRLKKLAKKHLLSPRPRREAFDRLPENEDTITPDRQERTVTRNIITKLLLQQLKNYRTSNDPISVIPLSHLLPIFSYPNNGYPHFLQGSRDDIDSLKLISMSRGQLISQGDAISTRRTRIQERLVYEHENHPEDSTVYKELIESEGVIEQTLREDLEAIAQVPWFRPLVKKLLSQADGSREPSTQHQYQMTLTAHGARYRCDFFDSGEEAAVGILLERYLPNFRIARGDTFQCAAGGCRIDFRAEDTFIEYHPPRLPYTDSRGNLKTMDCDDQNHARALLSKIASGQLTEVAVKQALAKAYEEKRRELVTEHYEGNKLVHLRDRYDLYRFLRDHGENVPREDEFTRDFERIRTAVSDVARIEELLSEELERYYPQHFNRGWESASGEQVSRPVKLHGAISRLENGTRLPIVTSFSHRSSKRVVEVFHPDLYFATGRDDDRFYQQGAEVLKNRVEREGFQILMIDASDGTQASGSELARKVLTFLLERELETALDPSWHGFSLLHPRPKGDFLATLFCS